MLVQTEWHSKSSEITNHNVVSADCLCILEFLEGVVFVDGEVGLVNEIVDRSA